MRIAVLHGDERFLIEEHTRRFAELLEAKFGGLEQFHFNGETVEPAILFDELRSYGLMQRHKLIILDAADSFLAGGGKNATEEDDAEDSENDEESDGRTSRRPLVERYAQNPVPDATFLMRAVTWRTGKLDKLIQKVGSINPCNTLDDAKAVDWCMKRCAKRCDATLEPAAAALLVERLGPDLLHLNTELMKLAAMAGPGNPITRAIVAESVGLSREEKAWEIQGAILTGDASAMLTKLHELLEISQHDEVPITWAICDLFRKLHTVAHLQRRRVPEHVIRGQAKLWGSTGDAVLAVASQHGPQSFAQLLRLAIQTDVACKTGLGEPKRSLEGLLAKIADMLNAGAAVQH